MFERFEKTKKSTAVGMAAAAIAGFSGKAAFANGAEGVHPSSVPAATAEQPGPNRSLESALGVESLTPAQLSNAELHAMNTGKPENNIIANSAQVFPAGTKVYGGPSKKLPHTTIPQGNAMFAEYPRLRLKGHTLWAAYWARKHGNERNQAVDGKDYIWIDINQASKLKGYKLLNFETYNPDQANDYPFTFPVTISRDGKQNLMITSPAYDTHFEHYAIAVEQQTSEIPAEISYNGPFVKAKEPLRFIPASAMPPVNPPSAYGH